MDDLASDGFFPSDKRDMGEPFVPEEGKDALGISISRRFGRSENQGDASPPGFSTQLRLLFDREMVNLYRDVSAVASRFGLTIFLALLMGAIFYDVGETDKAVAGNLQSHFGALIFVLINAMFGTAEPALLSFPSERPVFLREYSTNHYSVLAYFFSRLTVEAVITGAQVFVQVGSASTK